MVKCESRSKSVATETRGDDTTTSGGRRQLRDSNRASMQAASKLTANPNASRPMRASKSESQIGTRTVPDKNGGDDSKNAPRSLEAKKQRRAKRTGYTHPAACPSNLDLFSMPDGGLSHSAAAQLRKKPCPFLHSEKSAGIPSDRIRDGNYIADRPPHTNKPCYLPPQCTDPITHKPNLTDDFKRDKTLIQGAAGVGSEKLTMMQATWFKERDPDEEIKGGKTPRNNRHCPETRPADDFYVSKHKRQFHDGNCHIDSVHIKHKAGQPEPMLPEDVAKWSKMKQVRIRGGEFIYNVAGQEDLLPAATADYTKADRPPSASHRAENDKRWLPTFYQRESRNQDSRIPKKYQESYDMGYVMGEITEPALGLYDGRSIVSDGGDWGQTTPRRSQPTRSKSARTLQPRSYEPSESGRSYRSVTPPPNYRSATPPPPYNRSVTPPRSATPREANNRTATPSLNYRSATPPPQFSPPARSPPGSVAGSVYSVDRNTRQVWSSPNAVTMGTARTPREL